MEDKPRAMIATLAICAETEEEADRLARSSDLLFLGVYTGKMMKFLPSVQTATDYPYTEWICGTSPDSEAAGHRHSGASEGTAA